MRVESDVRASDFSSELTVARLDVFATGHKTVRGAALREEKAGNKERVDNEVLLLMGC